MRTARFLADAGRLLWAAAPPVLVLTAITLIGPSRLRDHSPATLEAATVLGWRAATIATAVWFCVAVGWAGTRPWRDRRAAHQLERLRAAAQAPGRALVQVRTVVWSSEAGQHVAVVNVATGHTHRLWLPEVTLPVDAYAVVEQRDGGVAMVDWADAQRVEAAHRHERRHSVTSDAVDLNLPAQEHHDDVLQLIEETEQYLRQQEPRS